MPLPAGEVYNVRLKRYELRMPCGRLLFVKGSRWKGNRRMLHSFNKPRHLGSCWICGYLHGNPKASALFRFKFVVDTKNGVAVGLCLGAHSREAK